MKAGKKMAYGDFWKVVTQKDYDRIQEWISDHDFEAIDTESVDVAYLLFKDKYGKEIQLVEWVESEPKIDEETGEEYYDEPDTYRYTDSDNEGTTIEYYVAENEQVRNIANDMAQNHWRYASDLIPPYSDVSLGDYTSQLAQAGYTDY